MRRLPLAAAAVFAIAVAAVTREYWRGDLTSAELARPAPSAAGEPFGPHTSQTRLLLAGMWSPSRSHDRLSAFGRCLEDQTGIEVTVVLRERYSEGIVLLQQGDTHLALLCSGAAAGVTQDSSFTDEYKVVGRLSRDGTGQYRAVLVVREDDQAQTWMDLEGADIAWTDTDSLTGYRAFRAHLRSHGREPDRFFGDLTFTHAHDRSLEAVQRGVVRTAVVDEMIYLDDERRDELRVLWRSDAFAAPPFVVARSRPDLQEALHRLAERPECFELLGASSLEPASWDDYAALAPVVEAGR